MNLAGSSAELPIDKITYKKIKPAAFCDGLIGALNPVWDYPQCYQNRVVHLGGTSADPTYRSIGDHSETVQLDFDPTVINLRRTVEDILAVSRRIQRPVQPSIHIPLVFPMTDEQESCAES